MATCVACRIYRDAKMRTVRSKADRLDGATHADSCKVNALAAHALPQIDLTRTE